MLDRVVERQLNGRWKRGECEGIIYIAKYTKVTEQTMHTKLRA